MTDGRWTDWYTINSPCEPSAQVSYKYDGLESPMLQTKFRGNLPTGSGEEDF